MSLIAPSAGFGASRPDEGIQSVLFDGAATLDAERRQWRIPLHAWVYQPQQSRFRRDAIAALFERRYGLKVGPDNTAVFDRRINLLLADNLPGRALEVSITNQQGRDLGRFRLPATGANGHTRAMVTLPISDDAPVTGGHLVLRLVEASATGKAALHLLTPDGPSIISDIDDTVKQTGVTDRAQLWRSTFFEPFKAVPGMADLLTRVGRGGAVHYVSSSPWHLYQPLREWLAESRLPVTSLALKQIRLKDRAILDITKSPIATKPPAIRALLDSYPQRQFTLVGDSGEKDPEVYAAIAQQYPQRAIRILIRQAPGADNSRARFDAAFAPVRPGTWATFDDPATVT